MTAAAASPLVLATLLAFAGASAFGQTAPAATPAAPAAPAAPAQAVPDLPAPRAAATNAEATDAAGAPLVESAQPATKTKEAKVEHLVTEDSQVRIDETRVRGVTTKIVVHSKIPGMGSYEIQPRNPAVDRQNDPAAGMRLFNFGW
jgi:hypothetical protein